MDQLPFNLVDFGENTAPCLELGYEKAAPPSENFQTMVPQAEFETWFDSPTVNASATKSASCDQSETDWHQKSAFGKH
jgi:hypothetical protein